MEERGYYVGNLDCTIIAQKPKLSPHKVCGSMRGCASMGAGGGKRRVSLALTGQECIDVEKHL